MPTITIYDEQDDLPLSHVSVENVARFLLEKHFVVPCEEWIVHFVSLEKIATLHAEFFDDPTETDCITFPIDADENNPQILGEVFICPAFALRYCEQNGGDPYEETTLYLIHTLLHLLGYNDIEPIEENEMRKEEKQALDHLKEKHLLLQR